MITKVQIEFLQQRLAWALNQADKAKAAAIAAETAYDTEFDKVVDVFDAEHPELVAARETAQKAQIVANEQANAIREEAKHLLGDYFLRPDAEAKPADGFSMRTEKEAQYDAAALLREAVEKKVTFMLKLDEKAIQKFVVANAEKEGDLWAMPDYLRDWLPGLDVMTIHKPLISDKTLIANAPEQEPEANVDPSPNAALSSIPF